MVPLFGKIVDIEARGQNGEAIFTNFHNIMLKKVAVLFSA